MRTLLIIITISILCLSCGKKGNPEYKSQGHYNKIIYLI